MGINKGTIRGEFTVNFYGYKLIDNNRVKKLAKMYSCNILGDLKFSVSVSEYVQPKCAVRALSNYINVIVYVRYEFPAHVVGDKGMCENI